MSNVCIVDARDYIFGILASYNLEFIEPCACFVSSPYAHVCIITWKHVTVSERVARDGQLCPLTKIDQLTSSHFLIIVIALSLPLIIGAGPNVAHHSVPLLRDVGQVSYNRLEPLGIRYLSQLSCPKRRKQV